MERFIDLIIKSVSKEKGLKITQQDLKSLLSTKEPQSFSKLFYKFISQNLIHQKALRHFPRHVNFQLESNPQNEINISVSFCQLLIKLDFCSLTGNQKKEDFIKVFVVDPKIQMTKENLSQFLKLYAQALKIQIQEADIEELKSQIQQKKYFKNYEKYKISTDSLAIAQVLNSKIKEQPDENYSKEAANLEDEAELFQKFQKFQKQCLLFKKSKLDYLIYKNLEHSFRSRMKNRSAQNNFQQYSSQDYSQFKEKLIMILREYCLLNHHIKQLIDTPINQKEGEDYFNKIYSIRNQIHPVYIPDFLQLVQKNKFTQSLVKNKNVVVALGISGAGKTTLVQLILGYEMKILERKGQLTTLVPIRPLKKEHQQFVAKASTKSVTSYCSAIQLQNIMDQEENSEIYFVDTPGFFDSGGIAVQSSNAISTLRVLSAAASLRVIFIINEKNFGTRGQGFKKLAKVISMLFNRYEKSKPIFFLNRFDQKSLQQLPIQIKKMKEQLNEDEKADTKFLQVITHFEEITAKAQREAQQKNKNIKDTLNKNSQVAIMDPFNVQLDLIEDKIKQPARAIKKPKQILANIIPQQVRIGLCGESTVLQTIIQQCLKNKSQQNIETLLYTVKQLTQFAFQTQGSNDVGEAGKKLDKIRYNLEQEAHKIYREIEECLEKKVLSLRVDQMTVINCKKDQERLLSLQKIMSGIPGIKQTNYENKIDLLTEKTSKKLTELAEKQLSKDLVHTIFAYRQISPDVWKQLKIFVGKIGMELNEQNIKQIEDENYKNIQQNVKKLQRLRQVFSGIEELDILKNQWKHLLKLKIQKRLLDFNKFIADQMIQTDFQVLTEQNLELMITSMKIFSVVDIPQRKQLKQVSEAFKNVQSKIQQLTKRYIHEIRKITYGGDDLVNKSEALFSIVFRCSQNAKLIMENIEEVRQQVKRELDIVLSTLAEFIRGKKAFIDNLLEKSQNDQNSWPETKPIYTNIKTLNKLTELITDKKQRKNCLETINMCKEKLQHQLNNEKQFLNNKIISLQTPSIVIKNSLEVYQICNSICTEQNQKKEEIKFSKIQSICQQIKNTILRNIVDILDDIDKTVRRLQQFSMKNIERSRIFQINDIKENLIEKKEVDNIETLIGQYSRILSIIQFFQIVKNAHLRPNTQKKRISEMIRQFNKDFSSAFDQLTKQINNQIKMCIEDIEEQQAKNILIKRETGYRIKRMINSFYKFTKNEEIFPILSSFGDLEIKQIQIKENISDLKQALQKQYSSYYQSKKYSLFKCISQTCQNLKCLDEFNIKNQMTFAQIFEDMKSQNKKIQCEKEINIEYLIKQQVVISTLKQIHKYYHVFSESTRQYEKLSNIIESLREHFDKRQKELDKQIKKNTRKYNEGLSDKIYEIIQKIESLKKQQKDVNSIFKKQIIKLNTVTEQLIDKEIQKLIRTAINKIKRMFEKQELTEIKSSCNTLQQLQQFVIDLLPNKNLTDKIKEENGIPTQISISDYYQNKKNEKTKERNYKYFGDKIIISENFSQQFQGFSTQEKVEISNNLKKQAKKQFSAIKINNYKNIHEVLKHIDANLKKYDTVPEKIRQELEKYAQEKKAAVDLQQNKIIENISKSWKLQTAYQSFKQAKENNQVFYYHVILKHSNQKYDQIINSIKINLQKQNTVNEAVIIIKQKIIQPIQKQVLSEDQYKQMVQKKADIISNNLNFFVLEKGVKRIQNMLDKKQRNDEYLLEFENQLMLSLEKILHVMALAAETKKSNILKAFRLQDSKNQLKKILQKQFQKIKALPVEINIENLVKKSEEILVYNINNTIFNLLLDKVSSVDLDLSNQMNQFKQKNKSVQQNLKKIKTQIQEMKKRIKGKALTKQVMKSNSTEERNKYFQGLIYDMQSLKKFVILLPKDEKPNYKNFIDKKQEQIKIQIQQGHRNAVQSLDKGFENFSIQFDKIINLMVDLGKLQSYHSFNPKKDLLIEKIKQKYNNVFEQIKKSSAAILNRKSYFRTKIKEIQQKYSNLKSSYAEEQGYKFQEKKQDIVKKIKDLEADKNKNQQKIKQSNDQIWQLQKEKQENIQNFKLKQNKSQESQLQNLNKQLSGDIANYAKDLTIAYKSAFEIEYDRDYFKQIFQKQLYDDSKAFGKRIVSMVYKFLVQKWKCTYSSILINNSQVFKTNQALQWQAKVKGRDINYVLNTMKLNNATDLKFILTNLFNNYSQQFKKWTQKYQKQPSPNVINILLSQIKAVSLRMSKFYHQSASDSLFHPQKLLAQIFALWTITGSDFDQQDMTVQFTYQPHPAQIVAIFLSLNLYQKQRSIPSKMAQILTGQGKSIVLGGMSAYLALCGFQVHSVCYSSYLAKRDYDVFRSFFQRLQINKSIFYGTFDTACQYFLNSSNGKKGLRDILHQILTSKKQGFFDKLKNFIRQSVTSINQLSKSEQYNNKKIMLIDQVDVFFDPTLFGSLYCPDITLESSNVKKLIRDVWGYYQKCKKGNKYMKKQQIMKTQSCQKVKQQHQRLVDVLEEQIKGMILACRGADHNDDYIVKNDLIQYKNQDTITSKVHYGFQTVFSYLKQNSQNRISSTTTQRQLKISLIVGQFSYALLPTFFKSIIGVTGTYQILPKYKKKIMKDSYNVAEVYLMPSVYGNQNQRKIQSPIITTTEQIWNQVIKQIKRVHETGRPVLVFFRNRNDISILFNSVAYEQLQRKTTFLHEEHNADDRNIRINNTCTKGKITFMTRSFGRGTDFIVHDDSILQIDHGGLHVIQTFISVEKSEEIQIMGRTARQGNPGTYQLIIPEQDLQLLQIQSVDSKNPFDDIEKAREKIQNNQMNLILKKLNDCNQKHKQSISLYSDQKVNLTKIVNYIQKVNSFPQLKEKICKTSILVDATGSMDRVLKNLLNVLGEVVRDVMRITNENKEVSSSQLQICIYRNYNCAFENLFQSTLFQTQSASLQKFLNNVAAQGGSGNQALQVALSQINKTPGIDQIIIIADAPGNTEKQVINKRNYFGENYWNSKQLPVLSVDQQMEKIKNKKIQVHSFYVSDKKNVKEYFTNLSRMTGGTCERFNPTQKDAASKLSQFIAQRILVKASPSGNQQKIINEYRQMRNVR